MSNYKRKKRLPSLNALRAFESAARHMSFKQAAEELNVSQSAVSHQVKGLEDSLGIALFARRTRGVELTRKGTMYYPVLRSAFESIAEATDMILEEHSVSVLTLHVYSTFTIRWLLPRLARFQESRKEVQVRLHTAQSDVNFELDDVDAAIMIGQPGDKALQYDKLFSCELSPVCSPSYLEKHGALQQPADLHGHTLLQVYPSTDDWSTWLDANRLDDINPDTGLQLESYDVALASAAQGMGIALGQQPYISTDLQTNALVEIFPEHRVANPNSWYFVCRKEKSQQKKMEIFRAWLLHEIREDGTLSLSNGH